MTFCAVAHFFCWLNRTSFVIRGRLRVFWVGWVERRNRLSSKEPSWWIEYSWIEGVSDDSNARVLRFICENVRKRLYRRDQAGPVSAAQCSSFLRASPPYPVLRPQKWGPWYIISVLSSSKYRARENMRVSLWRARSRLQRSQCLQQKYKIFLMQHYLDLQYVFIVATFQTQKIRKCWQCFANSLAIDGQC